MLFFSGVSPLLASFTAFPFSARRSVGYCTLFLRGCEPVNISKLLLSSRISSICANIDECYGRATGPGGGWWIGAPIHQPPPVPVALPSSMNLQNDSCCNNPAEDQDT